MDNTEMWVAVIGCYAMMLGIVKWMYGKMNGHGNLVSKESCRAEMAHHTEKVNDNKNSIKELRKEMKEEFAALGTANNRQFDEIKMILEKVL